MYEELSFVWNLYKLTFERKNKKTYTYLPTTDTMARRVLMTKAMNYGDRAVGRT